MSKFHEHMDLLEELEKEHDKRISVGDIIMISIDTDSEAAHDRIDTDSLLEEANRDPSQEGTFETREDLKGYYVAGTPDEVAEQLQEFVDRGIDHIGFDMRHSFNEIDYMMGLLQDEVIPQIE